MKFRNVKNLLGYEQVRELFVMYLAAVKVDAVGFYTISIDWQMNAGADISQLKFGTTAERSAWYMTNPRISD